MPGRTAAIESARRSYERGLAAVSAGEPRRAERDLLRCVALLSEADQAGEVGEVALVAARAMITLAYVDFELSGFDAALDRLAAADAVVAERGLAQLHVPLRNQRGLLLLRLGRLTEAIAEFDAGVATFADAPESERCKILLNRAVAHMEVGSVAAARADLNLCLHHADAGGLVVLKVKATHNLGFVEFMAGNLPLALHLMDAAFALDESVAPGTAHLGKAQVLVEAGLLHEADDALVAAARIYRGGRLLRDLAETELERASCALAAGDARAARRLAGSARDRFRRSGAESLRRGAELVLLQAVLAGKRADPRLLSSAQRLRAELDDQGLRLPARIAALIAAEAHLAAGQVQAAADALADLGPARRDDPITGRMHAHYVRARVDAACGRSAAASRRARRALGELADYQASFGSIDLRTASAVHGRRLAELDIALALDAGRPASVFAAAERARAVSSRLPAVRPPADAVAAELLAELRQTVESLRGVEQDRAASVPLLGKRRDLERQIVARTWTVAGTGSAPAPAALDEVRGRLAERDRTMVTYVQAGTELSAVVVGRRLRVHHLGPSAPVIEWVRRARADLDVVAHPQLPDAIRVAVRSSLQRSIAELDAALIRPLDVAGALVLVSTGVLGQLPWASLPSLRGVSLVVAPSATKWLASTQPRTTSGTNVVALAGPDLARAAHEADAVGAAWPKAQVVTGEAATRDSFIAAMGTSNVLHVAAHGVHQPENPLFSSLRLADGPVFAHELDQTALAPEHIVLSACEVGLATVRPGDEALGLASVLLNLGTRSVIAGVARVGDELAEQTMAAYHSRLAAGTDSADALAQALVEVDAAVAPPFVNFGAAWTPDLEPATPLA